MYYPLFKTKKQNNFLGLHAVTVVGYNEKTFTIRNSWGKNWNDNGNFKLNTEYFNKLCNDTDPYLKIIKITTPKNLIASYFILNKDDIRNRDNERKANTHVDLNSDYYKPVEDIFNIHTHDLFSIP